MAKAVNKRMRIRIAFSLRVIINGFLQSYQYSADTGYQVKKLFITFNGNFHRFTD